MKNLLLLISILLAFMIGTLDVTAQCFLDPITGRLIQSDGSDCLEGGFAVPFLRMVPEARSGALGGLGLATSPDANAVHFNVSKLAFVDKKFGLSVNYNPWLRSRGFEKMYLAYISGYKKMDENQTLGFSLKYFSLGNLRFFDPNGTGSGPSRPNEFEIGLGYSRKLSPYFAAGLSGKFVYSSLASGQTVGGQEMRPGISGALDLSVTYRRPNLFDEKGTLSWALAISNVGSKLGYSNSISKDFLPANIGIGGAFEYDFNSASSLMIGLDLNKRLVPRPYGPLIDENANSVPDFKEVGALTGVWNSLSDSPNGLSGELKEFTYSLGMEYNYLETYALRAGYYFEQTLEAKRNYFTTGLGFKIWKVNVGYSYLFSFKGEEEVLNKRQQISLSFYLGETRKGKSKVKVQG